MNHIECFEIPNTFTRDFPLDKQIELGICDWQAQIGIWLTRNVSEFGEAQAKIN